MAKDKKNFIPPTKRKAPPSDSYLLGVIDLADPKGKPPTPVFQFKEIKSPNLYKVFAEDQLNSTQGRPNKPLFIGPNKTTHVSILTWQGQEIGKLTYYGTYGKQYRYYSGHQGGIDQYGWQIAKLAKEVSGAEWVWLKDNKTIWGPVHPSHREGFYK